MKLVDILARELKVWPEGVSKLAQSFAGMVFYQDSAQQIVPLGRMEISDDFRDAEVTRAEWQAAVDALNAPKVVEWDGIGLPPVGLDVEVMQGGLPSVAFDWEACKILAINTGSDDKPQVITRDFRGDVAIYYPGIDSVYFRPIRIAEQVAAEERKAEILEMIDTFGLDTAIWGRDAVMEICGHLWEAGYRKQVTK